ncbi:unnamed protein product, partial [Staurois parvus]
GGRRAPRRSYRSRALRRSCGRLAPRWSNKSRALRRSCGRLPSRRSDRSHGPSGGAAGYAGPHRWSDRSRAPGGATGGATGLGPPGGATGLGHLVDSGHWVTRHQVIWLASGHHVIWQVSGDSSHQVHSGSESINKRQRAPGHRQNTDCLARPRVSTHQL